MHFDVMVRYSLYN